MTEGKFDVRRKINPLLILCGLEQILSDLQHLGVSQALLITLGMFEEIKLESGAALQLNERLVSIPTWLRMGLQNSAAEGFVEISVSVNLNHN